MSKVEREKVDGPRASLDPSAIIAAGEEIYRRYYQEEYEKEHRNEYAAIEIKTEQAYLGEFPEVAIKKAKESSPEGVFFLVHIGWPTAFRTSRR